MGTSVSPCLGGPHLHVVPLLHVLKLVQHPTFRGLHSSTFQLNLSALYGIGVARRGCVAHVKGGSGGVSGVQGVFL